MLEKISEVCKNAASRKELTSLIRKEIIRSLGEPISQSDADLSCIKDSAIWLEMEKAGILGAITAQGLQEYFPNTLGKVLDELERTPRALHWLPNIGPSTFQDIVDFIQLRYGFTPNFSRRLIELPQQEGFFQGTKVILGELDDLAPILNLPIPTDKVGISRHAEKSLEKHKVFTVGDFLILSRDQIKTKKILTDPNVRKIRDFIKTELGIDKTALNTNPPLMEMVRWKYLAMQVQEQAEKG